jgi:hypothetical protein
MRELYYENQGTNTYLVYEINKEDELDSMSLGMITNNNINGLAQTLFTQMDNKKYIKFNVSAKVSLSEFFSGAINKKRLIGVFSNIVDALLTAEDYMLEADSILLDLKYIFVDVSTCDTDLICLPLDKKTQEKQDLKMFFRNIIINARFDETENCDYVTKLINYLNGTPLFSLNDFKNLLNENKENHKENYKEQSEDKNQYNKQPAVPKTQASKDTSAKVATAPVQPKVPTNQQAGAQPSMLTRSQGTASQNKISETSKPKTSEIKIEKPKAEEPKITFFYLMQHYNKENAAMYKAQKEERKREAAAKKGKGVDQKNFSKEIQQKAMKQKEKQASGITFAVPGQDSPISSPTPQANPAQAPIPTKVANDVTASQSVDIPVAIPTEVPQGQAANFGETTVLGGGETTVLNMNNDMGQDMLPHLIRKKNNTKITLNKPVFRVGKERSYVDYFIGDNTAISRSHANFITRDGEHFVVDTNSTNHTFVNGKMVQSNVEHSIAHGDTVRLANEDFEFRLY